MQAQLLELEVMTHWGWVVQPEHGVKPKEGWRYESRKPQSASGRAHSAWEEHEVWPWGMMLHLVGHQGTLYE